ncbi:MAG TPA: hypothetical protein VNO30_21360 [Kofleriaceae bacterium]|nr:hypothetical protein [Kofleriaceae bacterium]
MSIDVAILGAIERDTVALVVSSHAPADDPACCPRYAGGTR